MTLHRRSAALPGLLLALAAGGCSPDSGPPPLANDFGPILDRPGVRGVLSVALFDGRAASSDPSRLETTFVNGAGGTRAEDNDLRGYLDGGFKWAWNQPGQVHVRLGRRGSGPRFAEHELFRVIQRWDGLRLPADTSVHEARLTLHLENGPEFPLRVLLYAVNKPWDPGRGGELRDNVSPPAEGEVWWRDVGYRVRSWGLPGAGLASDEDPDADTPAMPLAEARYEPGGERIEFAGAELAGYIGTRVAKGEPLLFLLKLSDYQEDLPGTTLELFSMSHGDSGNLVRRPALTLNWSSATERASLRREVFLEYGRRLELPPIATDGAGEMAVNFSPLAGYEAPTIELWAEPGGEGAWTRVEDVVDLPADRDRVRLRLTAAANPLALGRPFRAALTDTWVRTKPPAEQEVPWIFVSPSGMPHRVDAVLRGEHTWAVEFLPDEVGPWRYAWRQNFTNDPYRSAPGGFDVLAEDRAAVIRGLGELSARIRALEPDELEARRGALRIQLARLERAGMQLETSASFAGDPGRRLLEALDDVRAALGRPVTRPLPLVPSSPPEWATH